MPCNDLWCSRSSPHSSEKWHFIGTYHKLNDSTAKESISLEHPGNTISKICQPLFPLLLLQKKKIAESSCFTPSELFQGFESIAYCTVVGNSLKSLILQHCKNCWRFWNLLPPIFGPFSKVYFQGLWVLKLTSKKGRGRLRPFETAILKKDWVWQWTMYHIRRPVALVHI